MSKRRRKSIQEKISIARVLSVSITCFLTILFAVAADPQIPPEISPSHKRIVLLHAYGDEIPVYQKTSPAFITAMEAGGVSRDDLFFEYLDLTRNKGAEYRRNVAELLRYKYAEKKIDLVVTLHGMAVDFLVNEGRELFAGAPVLSYLTYETTRIEGTDRRFLLLPMQVDNQGILEVALEFFPMTRRVVYILGVGEGERRLEAEAKSAFAPWQGKLELEFTSNLTVEEMLKRVSELPPGSVVMYNNVWTDKTGRTFIGREIGEKVAKTANAPVFSFYDTLIGRGIVGGSLLSFEAEAARAGRLALDILGGNLVLTEPVTVLDAGKTPMFDWRELKRWGLTEDKLPPGSVLVNYSPSFWERYKKYVIGSAGFVLAQSLLIAGLLLQRRRRKKAEDKLREYAEHLDNMVQERTADLVKANASLEMEIGQRKRAELSLRDSLDNIDLVLNASYHILYRCEAFGDFDATYISGNVETVFGYTPNEFLQKGFWASKIHPEDKTRVFAELNQLLDHGFHKHEYRFQHKNGSWRWAYDELKLVKDEQSNPRDILGSIVDITDRKKAEELTRIRMGLLEYSATHSLDELLQRTLDEIGSLTNSPIGFYHFISEDEKSIHLQVWSTWTMKEFCTAEGEGLHYPVDQGGVWTDAIRERRAVIHNDYASLPHRKGMPEGHAAVIRELVVPIMRSGRIVAILGIGNKPEDYTEKDAETVSFLADVAWEVALRKRAETERERLMAAIEQAGEIVMVTDPAGAIQYVNPAFEQVTGYSREEVLGKSPKILRSGMEDKGFYRHIFETVSSGRTWEGRKVNKRKDGTFYTEDATISPVRDASGLIVNYVVVSRDITEHLRLADQFQQAQKLESVGRLAGGVAHDFNNMLGIILGYSEIALMQAGEDTTLHENLTQIRKAAARAADLTRQLLTFARKQIIDPRVLNVNAAVEGMLKMLRRLMGENLDLAWLPGKGLWPVKMDPTQVDQILANICVNARDAITDVGKVTIETENVVLDEAYCAAHVGFVPGEFVVLAVSDNGCGMDEETRKNVFEPFFTTKEMGKGTGLGLSTVYGIVKQNNGFINVYSEPGRGTTFKIYLPRHEGMVETGAAREVEFTQGRGETVLLVEDDQRMLEMSKRLLEALRYTVLAAATPTEAMRLAGEHAGKIDLLMTDVVMPEMNGRELAGRLLASRPGLKCLFMSGYTANAISHHGVLEEGVQFIQKPFSMKDLAAKVRMALDS